MVRSCAWQNAMSTAGVAQMAGRGLSGWFAFAVLLLVPCLYLLQPVVLLLSLLLLLQQLLGGLVQAGG